MLLFQLAYSDQFLPHSSTANFETHVNHLFDGSKLEAMFYNVLKLLFIDLMLITNLISMNLDLSKKRDRRDIILPPFYFQDRRPKQTWLCMGTQWTSVG